MNFCFLSAKQSGFLFPRVFFCIKLDIPISLCYNQLAFGVWLSLVERLVRDQEVGCSNHLTPTRKITDGLPSVIFLPGMRNWDNDIEKCCGGEERLSSDKSAGNSRRGSRSETRRVIRITSLRPIFVKRTIIMHKKLHNNRSYFIQNGLKFAHFCRIKKESALEKSSFLMDF